MASKIAKPTFLKSVANRGYAAQAAIQTDYTLPAKEPIVTTLPSGAVVASIENNGPVSKVAMLFKAGSRYEMVTNAGVSHVLRRGVGLSTSGMTSFGVVRKSLQEGAGIDCEGGRDHIMYSVDIIRDNIDYGLNILGEVGTKAVFKPWEIPTLNTWLKKDLILRDNTTLAVENVHKAAFRGGLGNSLFVPTHRIGKISSEDLQDYVAKTHGAAGMAIVGIGVEHDTLLKFVNALTLPGAKAGSSATFNGGESRTENGSSLAYVAVCGSGASLGSADHLALAVAQYALGTASTVKYGGNASNKLSAAAGASGVASAINVNYGDAGLFGYLVIADADAAGSVVKAVHDTVKNCVLTDADVANAKNKLKSALLMSTESLGDTLEDIGLQALLTGKYVKPGAAAAAIGGVTTEAVNAALKKVVGGKLSMGAAGGLQTVPYLDQL